MSVIYGLQHPITGEIRYVGKTARDPRVRLADHMRNANAVKDNYRQRRLSCWIRSLPSAPLMVVLELNPECADDAERSWIRNLRQNGVDLCNMTDGGEGQSLGYTPSDAARAKLSAVKRSPDVIRRVAEKLRGRKRTPEQRALMSALQIGKPATTKGMRHTAESLSKMSASQKAVYASGKRTHRYTGHSPEIRQKMSEGIKRAYAEGRKVSWNKREA